LAERLELVGNSRLTPWHAALANRNNARVDVGILGASIVEAAFVSTFNRTIAACLADGLRARFPTRGLSGGGRGYIGIPSTELTTSPQYVPGMWPLAFTGGLLDPPSNNAPSAFDIGAKHMCWYSNQAGAKLVDTLAGPVTSFDIHHVTGASGAATTGYYKVDASPTPVPFPTNSATDTAAVLHVASPATSSIEVGRLNAGYVIVGGIREFNGDEAKGIQVHNLGHAGFTIAEWTDGSTTPGRWRADIANLGLDLLLQDLGINDGPTLSLAQIKTSPCCARSRPPTAR
jgi:hypothetical protein